jgi:hypothetical protein
MLSRIYQSPSKHKTVKERGVDHHAALPLCHSWVIGNHWRKSRDKRDSIYQGSTTFGIDGLSLIIHCEERRLPNFKPLVGSG